MNALTLRSASAGTAERSLTEPWLLGGVRVPNRVLLAPLAGIGNWFVRLQAKRYGAGMAVSEMISSHAIHYGNRRTLQELLRIDPRERERGPVSIQLFGQDPRVMRSAAATASRTGADVIDLNMGCPVPKVCKTGAGAALLAEPERALELARAAREGSGLPVTVKLRCGRGPGDHSGLSLARRLVTEAGVSAIALHPRSAVDRHSGRPDYELVARLVQSLDAPVILTGGLREAGHIRAVFRATGAAAVMLARGALGNPWLFRELAGRGCGTQPSSGWPRSCGWLPSAPSTDSPRGRASAPTAREVVEELGWVMDRAVEHLDSERATRYLRKFYPWYLARLGLERAHIGRLAAELQSVVELERARELLLAASEQAPLAA
jgi:tRNA-dihydrouridine synthase B